ncbi:MULTISPECIES: PIG-L deacetylase family protein [Subtercola]|uniref:GlcNAc-PI de-N-acetylase n=1 Tax=Subtercola vilae TaxID=2056433 RepID=A0A4T2CAQ2_9MICO|nr:MULTISPECIES: PIG-L family deacetylase [Subtercola]MEA9984908.1 PIG-L family deacetylase [Subtercola sp. RTI3]TIH40431.1 hypothetical protein D4765_02465 [Subtercola vilae]
MVFPELTEGGGGSSEPTVLLLHAHPDDETIATGGLMAHLVSGGVRVVLLTGTRGERGEVVAGPLEHLEGTAELAAVRVHELSQALAELGVTEHRFLGTSRLYSDSGMRWGDDGFAKAASDAPADALSLAPFEQVVAEIGAVIAEVTPSLVVTYDERGGYGHPDHVRIHEAGIDAASAAGVPVYVIVAEAAEAEAEAGDIAVPLGPFRAAKMRALGAHRTQLSVDGDDIVHSGGQRQNIPEVEVFRRWKSS